VKKISERTGLSDPTVRKKILKLRKKDLVQVKGVRDTSLGRKPKLYQLNASAYFVVGIDFEIPDLRIGIYDLTGQLVSNKLTYFREKIGQKDDNELADFLVKETKSLIHNSHHELSRIAGFGIGVPGLVTEEGFNPFSRTVFNRRINLSPLLQDELHNNLIMLNDVDLELIAELDSRNLLYSDDTVAVYLSIRPSGEDESGVSVGGGVWYRGSLLHGTGSAAEFGHTSTYIEPSTEGSIDTSCKCGNPRCFESFLNHQIKNSNIKKVSAANSIENAIVEKLKDLVLIFNPTHLLLDLSGISKNSETIASAINTELDSLSGVLANDPPIFINLPNEEMRCSQGGAIAILSRLLNDGEMFWETFVGE